MLEVGAEPRGPSSRRSPPTAVREVARAAQLHGGGAGGRGVGRSALPPRTMLRTRAPAAASVQSRRRLTCSRTRHWPPRVSGATDVPVQREKVKTRRGHQLRATSKPSGQAGPWAWAFPSGSGPALGSPSSCTKGSVSVAQRPYPPASRLQGSEVPTSASTFPDLVSLSPQVSDVTFSRPCGSPA